MKIRLLLALLFSPMLLAQCANHSWESPWKTATPVSGTEVQRLAPLLPAGTEARYAVELASHDDGHDEFVAYDAKNARSGENPQDGGFLFVHAGKVVAQQSLMSVDNWRKFARDIGPADKPAFSVFVTEFCSAAKLHLAIGFSACCSDASAVLYFLATPDGNAYKLASLPVVGGGRLQIFPGHPIELREWSGMEDGKCEQCEQHFRVTSFHVVNGAPVVFKIANSDRMYKPGEFAPHRISLEGAEK